MESTPPASNPPSVDTRGLPQLGAMMPAGALRRYGEDIQRLHRLLDAVMAPLLLGVIAETRQGSYEPGAQVLGLLVGLAVAMLASEVGLYDSFRARSLQNLLRRLALLWGLMVGGVSLGLYAFKLGSVYSRELLLSWYVLYGGWLVFSHISSRQALRVLRERGHNKRIDGYIGSVEGFRRLAEQMRQTSWLGHSVTPLLTWRESEGPTPAQLHGLDAVLAANRPDQWLVEDPGNSRELGWILSQLENHTEPVLLLPRWLQQSPYEPVYCRLGPVAALQLWGAEATPMELSIKHGADLLVSAVLLVVLSPLLLLISVAVRLESPGPALFLQTRYGLRGEPFTCLKFRTMRVQENGAVVVQAQRQDPRITRLGSFLRKSNFDELPQLLNVIRGEMSLVGPRPHAAAHNEHFRSRVQAYMRRHALRPGITGWAQVLGLRGATETDAKMAARVQADLDYIRNWSLLLDLKILLMTVLRGRDRNAY